MDGYNQPSTFRRGGILILLIVIIFTIIIKDWKIIMAAAITALPFSSLEKSFIYCNRAWDLDASYQ